MVKPTLTLLALVPALALPSAHAGAAKPGPRSVGATLLRQMNSTPDGPITRSVDCVRTGSAPRTFTCRLESVRATSLRVDVAVAHDGLSTTWYPLEG